MNIEPKACFAILALLGFIAALGAAQPVRGDVEHLERVQETRFLLGTQVDVVVLAESRARGLNGLEACFEAIERVQALMSVHAPESPLSRLNRLAHERWIAPPEEIFTLIHESLLISRLTGGAFDITVKPLLDVWRRARKEGRPPPAERIRAALARVGYRRVELDVDEKRVHFEKPGMAIDLGGIAKGYALDRAAAALDEAGIDHALLNAGGDILTVGGKGEEDWLIGIRDPQAPDELLAALPVSGAAVVTSGDYERFFMHEGTRYHHILDPRTGYPAVGCRSVTVVHQQADLADVLATAAFVLGPEAGFSLIEPWPSMEALIVDDEGRKRITSRLAGAIVWR